MRVESGFSCYVGGGAMIALLAGCAGSSGAAMPSTSSDVVSLSVAHTVTNPNVRGSTIAISDARNGVVDIFDANRRQTKQLTGFLGPQGLSSDIEGDLYVADEYHERIAIFAAGLDASPRSLRVAGQLPVGVDSFENGKYVAAANELSDGGGPGSITIFKDGKPVRKIVSASLFAAYACAFDASGNLFVSGYDASYNPSVGEVARAISPGGSHYTELSMANKLLRAGGIQVTTNGQIAVGDQQANVIYTYGAPIRGSLGSPIQTTHLPLSRQAAAFAFTNGTNSLYTADFYLGLAFQYAYPAGGSPLSIIAAPGSQPAGIAVIPTQYPKGGK